MSDQERQPETGRAEPPLVTYQMQWQLHREWNLNIDDGPVDAILKSLEKLGVIRIERGTRAKVVALLGAYLDLTEKEADMAITIMQKEISPDGRE